mgnify:CR=1 FL=1
MAEYIEREAAIKAIYESDPFGVHKYFGWRAMDIEEALRAIPAVDVAPVRHERWVHSRYENCSEQFEIVKCSCCGHEAYAMAFYVSGGNYCPSCGAKMDGAE